jgi:hypothetical protein
MAIETGINELDFLDNLLLLSTRKTYRSVTDKDLSRMLYSEEVFRAGLPGLPPM